MQYLLNRLIEPSSWGGVGLLVLGLGEVLKFDEAPQIAGAINQAGEVVAQTGDPVTGFGALAMGLLAVLMNERARP